MRNMKMQSLKDFWGHNLDLLGSSDVIGHVTNGLAVVTFLLVVNDDHVSILHRYVGIDRYKATKLCLVHVKD